MNPKCIVFDIDENKYVEVELKDKNMLVHWMNYPVEIIYTYKINSAKYFDDYVWCFQKMLSNCKDMGEVRTVLTESSLYDSKIHRTSEEIVDLQDRAFELSEGHTDEYFAGVFDALGWVLGDELDEEIWGENNG